MMHILFTAILGFSFLTLPTLAESQSPPSLPFDGWWRNIENYEAWGCQTYVKSPLHKATKFHMEGKDYIFYRCEKRLKNGEMPIHFNNNNPHGIIGVVIK